MSETSPFAWMQVGHWSHEAARTGCTVIRFTEDVVASGEVRGGAPATREFALLDPTRLVTSVDAVCLSGGSAFGLDAAAGVAHALRADGVGFETAHGPVPIVIGMSLYDLGVGEATAFPGQPEGAFALDESSASFAVGQVGAGAGATIGKWRGADAAMPGGLGFAEVSKDDVTVCCIVAVNAAGEVVLPGSELSTKIASGTFDWPEVESPFGENTTIGVIATNANIEGGSTKAHCLSLGEAGHDGLARAIQPVHGPSDGDALVAVSRPEVETDLATVRMLAAVAVETAVRSAVSAS